MEKRSRGKDEDYPSSRSHDDDSKRVMMHRPVDASAIKYPPKPAANKNGRAIELSSNFFRVEIGKITLFQYHVDFKPEVDTIGRRFRLLGAFDAQKSKDPKGPEKDRFLGLIAFDGTMLFAKSKIDFGPQQTELRGSVTYFGSQFEVIIKLVKVIDNTKDIPEQFYNVLAKKFIRNLNLKRIKNKFFDVQNKLLVEDNHQKMSLWPCFDTKIAALQSGFALNLDVSFRISRGDTILDIINNSRRNARDYRAAAERELIGSSVIANYGKHNTWTIKEIHWDKSPDLQLEIKNKDGSMKKITIRQYMKERYQMVDIDRLPDQPLLLAEENLFGNKQRKPITGHLIPSLCTLAGFSDTARDRSRERQIPAAARLQPADRQKQVANFYNRIYGAERNKELMKDWGIKISSQTSTARGIELPLPTLKFENKQIQPRNGSWQGEMKNAHVFKKNFGNVALIIPERSPYGDVSQIQKSISIVCEGLGVGALIPGIKTFMIKNDDPQTYIDEVLKYGEKIHLAILCLPNNNEERYSKIKRVLTCGNVPITTQCVAWSKKLGLSVWTNIVLQICAKLGSVLWSIDAGLPGPTMVIGIDVNHSKTQNSIAGFVATLDINLSKYYSEIRQQEGKHAELVAMKDLAIQALRAFQSNNNGKLPSYVVVYRDGVGDSQMDAVKAIEIEALKEAFKTLNINPKLVFLVVQKRTTSRFYSRGDNPPPGTLLDTDLVDPVKYDFYMVAHTARQATVRPAHYYVIEDTTGWTPEYLQNLTYKFCHMYCNFSGTIAVPAPVKYAHKLAYQCGNHWSRDLPNPKLSTKLHFI